MSSRCPAPQAAKCAVAWVAEHTWRVASKYDSYWAGQLAAIRVAVERAASGVPAQVGLTGLRRVGDRQLWYGAVEVRGRDVTRSSMAHHHWPPPGL